MDLSKFDPESDLFQQQVHAQFVKADANGNGTLNHTELQQVIINIFGEGVPLERLEAIFKAFDNDSSGELDEVEFHRLATYVVREGRDSYLAKEKADTEALLKRIAKHVYRNRELLCIQTSSMDVKPDLDESMAVDMSTLVKNEEADDVDPDFDSAFSPSEMRCLALVSHNGMKPTMRKFVEAHKNLLKKFRLTGTNSTITMLKEVFADEPPGTVIYGPKCASGPLGGDAMLVAHMVNGHIGGVIFFRDPMAAHPHRADIDCLCRQALVNNMAWADTPTSALLMLHPLREALQGEGKPELIPSFFFQLQSPTVEEYKKGQKKVVDDQVDLIDGGDTKRRRIE